MSDVSSEEKSNLDVVKRAFEAFQVGDAEALMKSFAPEAHYHFAPLGKLTGDYRGVQAIMGMFGQIAQETQGTFRVSPVAMAASGNRVFVLYALNGKRDGKALETQDVGVFTLAGGVVTDAMVFGGNYPAGATFFS